MKRDIAQELNDISLWKRILRIIRISFFIYAAICIVSVNTFVIHKLQPKKSVKELTYSQIWNRNRIDAEIVKWCKYYSVPEYIVFAVQKAENEGTKTNAVSKAQACGLFQALPSTFYVMMPEGKHISHVPDNVQFAVMYLASLKQQHKTWEKVFSVYNSGRVDGHLVYAETKEYVQKCNFYALNGRDALYVRK